MSVRAPPLGTPANAPGNACASIAVTSTGVICIWIVPVTALPAPSTSAPAGNVTLTPSRPLALPPASIALIATAASRSTSITRNPSALRPVGTVSGFTCSAKPALLTTSNCSLPVITGSDATPLASLDAEPDGDVTLAPDTKRPCASITVTASVAVAAPEGTSGDVVGGGASPPPPPQAASNATHSAHNSRRRWIMAWLFLSEVGGHA